MKRASHVGKIIIPPVRKAAKETKSNYPPLQIFLAHPSSHLTHPSLGAAALRLDNITKPLCNILSLLFYDGGWKFLHTQYMLSRQQTSEFEEWYDCWARVTALYEARPMLLHLEHTIYVKITLDLVIHSRKKRCSEWERRVIRRREMEINMTGRHVSVAAYRIWTTSENNT